MMFNPSDLYKNTPDSDLTYTGTDTIVWDRINAERLRRGLPGLTAIGFPRPLDDIPTSSSGSPGNGQTYSFTNSNNQVFEVSVPAGMNESDARAFFDKELNAGKLTNLNIGQSLEGLSGKVSSALAQIGKLTDIPVGLPVSAAQVLKQVPSTLSLGSLDPKQITGLLGQASAAAGQAADAISADKGIGKFGLTPQQLQDQGFLKPGTVAQFIDNGTTDFTAVLKNPACWTGKDGAANLDNFLKNPTLQDGTQQSLMSAGFEKLKGLGTITGKENPQQLAAMVQGSAKFGTAAMAAWAGGAAPPGLVDSINSLAKNAQFAADLTGKLPDVAPAVEGVVNTVNRSTVDNSIKGFVKDEKVPAPTYGPVERQAPTDVNKSLEEKWTAAAQKWLSRMRYYQDKAQAIAKQLSDLESGTITREGWSAVDAAFQAVKAEYNAERQQISDEFKNTYYSFPKDFQDTYSSQYASAWRLAKINYDFLIYLRERIKDDEALIGT